jgi:hypothetical protein
MTERTGNCMDCPDLLAACEKVIDGHRAKSSNGHEVVISREAFDAIVAGLEKATGKKVLPERLAVPPSGRDVLLAACEMVPPLLKEIRGFASDVFGGESSLTDCIDLVLSETESAIAKTRG